MVRMVVIDDDDEVYRSPWEAQAKQRAENELRHPAQRYDFFVVMEDSLDKHGSPCSRRAPEPSEFIDRGAAETRARQVQEQYEHQEKRGFTLRVQHVEDDDDPAGHGVSWRYTQDSPPRRSGL